MQTSTRFPAVVAWACALLSGCGGGGGGGGSPPPPPQTFSVGGVVSGLDAVGLVLQVNGGPDLAISGNGSFTFPTQVARGAAYSVTIKSQPTIGPAQLCSLANGSGTVANGAVTNVAISCVSRVFKFLYVTSAQANEVRGYSIDKTDGGLAALPGPPVHTGYSPTSPFPDPAGRFMYLATRGNALEPPRVSVFAADNVTGALTETWGSPYDLSTPPPGTSAPVVLAPAFHASGGLVYFALISASAMLYGETIDATTGGLSQVPGLPIDIGYSAGGMTYDSTGRFLFVATTTLAGDGEIRSFRVNVPSGVLTPIGSFPTSGSAPVQPFLTPGDDYLLTANFRSGTLVVFAVDKAVGTLTPVTPLPTPTPPTGQAIGFSFNARNNVLYKWHVPDAGPSTVAAFRFDTATGGLTPVGTALPTNGVGGALLHPSGRFLFQYNLFTGSIQRFALDETTGALTSLPDVPIVAASTQATLRMDASGRFLYVMNRTDGVVSSYSIDATGSLTLINALPSPGATSMVPFLLQ